MQIKTLVKQFDAISRKMSDEGLLQPNLQEERLPLLEGLGWYQCKTTNSLVSTFL